MDAIDMTKIFAAAALVATLAGCAGSNYDIARRMDALRDYKGADAGTVVASEGGEHGHFDAAGVTFQRVGSEDLLDFASKVRGMLSPPDHDWEQSSTIGNVFVRRLPPGDYEAVFAHGEQYANSGWVRRPLPPGVRFTVKAGETVYIGRYVIGESRMSPIVIVSDRQADDLAIAARKLPGLAVDAVTSQVPPPVQRRL